MRVVDPVDGTPFHCASTSDDDLPTRSGVLHLRGDSNFLGYWQNSDATAETLTKDGWVDTGDLVILDERTRHVWIVGRKKVDAPIDRNPI
jgi:long-chain acyl-CoA synthetase